MGLWGKGLAEVDLGLKRGPDPEGIALRQEFLRH
jgi:hypothetical protein